MDDLQYRLHHIASRLRVSRVVRDNSRTPDSFWYERDDRHSRLTLADVQLDMLTCYQRRLVAPTPAPAPSSTPNAEWWHMCPSPCGSMPRKVKWADMALHRVASAPFEEPWTLDILEELQYISAMLEYTRRVAVERRGVLESLKETIAGLPDHVAVQFRTAADSWAPHAARVHFQARYEAILALIYGGLVDGPYSYRKKTAWRVHRAITRGRKMAAAVPAKEVREAIGSPFTVGRYARAVMDQTLDVVTCILEGKSVSSLVGSGTRVFWNGSKWERPSCSCVDNSRCLFNTGCMACRETTDCVIPLASEHSPCDNDMATSQDESTSTTSASQPDQTDTIRHVERTNREVHFTIPAGCQSFTVRL
ncbi:hypothetical protein CC85DRAFT_20083 [Cutaneotrichosporon oleaginosum]|uniref:Uncharacterized protein n=1 Tax=Cutaneotrichosporon oleaginosum TaxID=879819 RepID=A0A0J0XC99_9TREE|nr:uncharacterized protein CC85DRAFT_20083 [Cutaneotrichosporon oleaginosum]KLT38691.1 hypothetical protein CC85DRAFT_20083 [Cutaneotrichosporon oleaginosum]TXT08272.1 hypothetical protein COLE_05196 [Cutaneotrichosporon oleaginosum]